MAYFTIEGYDSYSGCDITVTASLPNINGQQMNKYYTLGSLQTLSISTHQDKRPVRSLGVINAKDYVMGPRTIAGSMVFAVFNRHFATEIMKDLGASDSEVLLPDEIPALNITINFANEYGRMSRMAIYGVKLINEGQVMSINDLYTENTYQFVALGLEPLSSSVDKNKVTSSMSIDKPVILATERKILNNTPINVKPRDIKFLDDYYKMAKATPRKILDDYYKMAKATSRKILDSDNKIFPQYTDDWVPELMPFIPGKDIVNEITNNKTIIDNNKDYNNNFILDDIINLEVDTQKTLAKFTLTPDQDNGTILISKAKNDSNEFNIEGTVQPIIKDHEYKIDVANKKNYIITLSPGEYVAQFESPNNEYSNIVDFITVNDNTKEALKNVMTYPFIDKMTDSYTIVSNGDYSHNEITYLLDGGILQHKGIGKAPIKIDGLKPDSNYLFYTDAKERNDLNKRSNAIKSKTHKASENALSIFKNFLTTNQNYLINDLNGLLDLLEGYNDDSYLSVIDLVLSLPNSLKKQELLIYANILNKQLIDSYNKSNANIIKQKIQSTPFSDTISIDNSTKAFVYSFDNYKSSLNSIVNPMIENFYGKKNKHYCIQTIDDGIKSVKYDFVICDKNYYNELKNYCDLENYKDINLDYYLITYNIYDYNVVQTLAIKDNCYCDIHILEEPFIYEEDDEIIADVDYLTLNEENDYYLVCSHIYDALDYVPKRKVKIPTGLSKLRLSNYYLGMIKNEKYLFWIENSEFLRISKPYIFSYTSDEDYRQLKTIEKNEIDKKLSRLKNDLLVLIDNKSLVTDLINYISSLNPSRKDLDSIIRMYFIHFFENSYAIRNTFIMFYYLIKITHSYRTINNLDLMMTLNIDSRTINIECEDEYYVCAIHYDSESYKRINIDKFIYYEDHGYTLIYLIHRNLNYQSGFVLLENSTGEILTSEDMVNVVKKVGGK